jgi:ABC-type branched-subunit amino acid transport system substrate-binding protein
MSDICDQEIIMKLKRLITVTAAAVSLAISSFAMASDTIKVGVLHSLSGTMAISETTLKDTVLITSILVPLTRFWKLN